MHGVHAANQTNNHFATAHMQAQESAHSFSKQKKRAHITSAHAKNRVMHLIVMAVIKNNQKKKLWHNFCFDVITVHSFSNNIKTTKP